MVGTDVGDADVGDTEIDSVAVVAWGVGVVESITCTVKLELPWLLGVPEMTPLKERLRPEGSEPAVTVQE